MLEDAMLLVFNDHVIWWGSKEMLVFYLEYKLWKLTKSLDLVLKLCVHHVPCFITFLPHCCPLLKYFPTVAVTAAAPNTLQPLLGSNIALLAWRRKPSVPVQVAVGVVWQRLVPLLGMECEVSKPGLNLVLCVFRCLKVNFSSQIS